MRGGSVREIKIFFRILDAVMGGGGGGGGVK